MISLERRREIARNYYHRHKKLKGRSYKKVICLICGKEFEANTNKKYCSLECKHQARLNTNKKYHERHKEQKRQYEIKNKEKINARRRELYKINGKERCANYRKLNNDKINKRIKEWRLKNPEKDLKIRSRYKEKNKEKITLGARDRQRKYRKNILYRLKNNISRAFSRYLNKEKPTKKYLEYFNYSLEDLYKHLEKQFTNQMNWDNYGSVWHIDHIKPQSWFDFSKEEEIKECWSLNNLQPLLVSENCKKGNRYAG